MPLRYDPPGAVLPRPAPGGARTAAQALWADWTRGVSPSTLVSRTSDLRLFGDAIWGARDIFAVIRRVLATLERGSDAFRELAVRWSEAQRERGASFHTRTRQWSTLARLVAFIGEQYPRRGAAPPSIGSMPREHDATPDVQKIIARAIEEGRDDDAVIVALAISHDVDEIAAMTIGDLRGFELAALAPVRHAIDRVCARRRSNAHAFAGRRRGRPITPQGIRARCERNGTTAAALRRLTKGAT